MGQTRTVGCHMTTVDGINIELERTSCSRNKRTRLFPKSTRLLTILQRVILNVITWDVVSIIFNVHLVKTSFSWGVLHCDSTILVVCNVWPGGST